MSRASGTLARVVATVVILIACLAGRVSGGNAFARQTMVGDVGFHGTAGPPGRSGHAAVATANLQMFIFGGRAASTNGDLLNDMWLYDWETGSWVSYIPNELLCDQCSTCQVTGSSCYDWTGLRPYSDPILAQGKNREERPIPSGRVHHAMALVLNRINQQQDTIVMFGGESIDCTDYCDDVWHYNIPNNLWTKKTFSANEIHPVRRWKHSMTSYFDAVFMFGGHSQRVFTTSDNFRNKSADEQFYYDYNTTFDDGRPLFLDDLWVYNATEQVWDHLEPECRVISYNETQASSVSSRACTDSTKEPDGTAERDVFGPRARVGASLVTLQVTCKSCVYGRTSNTDVDYSFIYLFGGYAYGGESNYAELYPTGEPDMYPSLNSKYFLNDVWRYDIDANVWEELEPRSTEPRRPSPRQGHSAAAVLRSSEWLLLIHGGQTWDDEIGDFWQYNFSSNVWTEVQPEGEYPSRRYGGTMVAVGDDEQTRTGSTRQSGRALLFGGHGCLRGKSYKEAADSAAASASAGSTAARQGRSYVTEEGTTVTFSMGSDGLLQVDGVTVSATGEPLFLAATDGTTQVQTVTDYGETICKELLDDLWQYLPDECPNDCSRAGTCSFNVCICRGSFFGTDCSQPYCPGSVCEFDSIRREMVCTHCNGRGDCIDGACTNCQYPSTGEQCENAAGLCPANDCACFESAGVAQPADCATASVTTCEQNPSGTGNRNADCSGNGYCIDGKCHCLPGFTDSVLVTKFGDVLIPARDYVNNTIVPAPECGYDPTSDTYYNPALVTSECKPKTYADCGGFLYQMASARGASLLVALVVSAFTFLNLS